MVINCSSTLNIEKQTLSYFLAGNTLHFVHIRNVLQWKSFLTRLWKYNHMHSFQNIFECFIQHRIPFEYFTSQFHVGCLLFYLLKNESIVFVVKPKPSQHSLKVCRWWIPILSFQFNQKQGMLKSINNDSKLKRYFLPTHKQIFIGLNLFHLMTFLYVLSICLLTNHDHLQTGFIKT